MIEVAFSDSAAGGLKIAQRYGIGPYRGGAIGVIVAGQDGAESTQEEIDRARKNAQEREKRMWESAVPMGGDPADVFGFHLALSVGEIAEEGFVQNRLDTLRRLFAFYPEEARDAAAALMEGLPEALETVLSRAAHGEPVRIWYSEKPDDRCGLCWLADQLVRRGTIEQIFLVKLPEVEIREKGSIVTYSGWDEMEPGGFGRYASQARQAAYEELRYYAAQWKDLQQENAALRAVVSGRLCSVPEDFYDGFIRREIARQPEEFEEAALIGRILGQYQLGVGDGWIALRIEQMVQNGELAILTRPGLHEPAYHRRLKKRQ